jgi:hypothetical protein
MKAKRWRVSRIVQFLVWFATVGVAVPAWIIATPIVWTIGFAFFGAEEACRGTTEMWGLLFEKN